MEAFVVGESEKLFDSLVCAFGLTIGLWPVSGGHFVFDVEFLA